MKTHMGVLTAAILFATSASAQQWPTRPIEMIIPLAAGGGTDTTGRRVARAMAANLGQSIVVINRDGASGSIGFNALGSAAPDGYTLGGGPTTPIANATHLFKGLRYDLDSFEYICRTFDNVFVIAVPTNSRFKSAQDLFAAAKADPGKLVFGHAGVSSNSHLSVENLADGLKLQFQPVAFRGDSPMLPEVLAGRLDFGALSLLSVLGQDIRVLVTFAEERVPLLPDVPTAKELGVRHVPTLNGVFAPKGLPAPVKASLENACAVAMRDTEVQQFIINGGQVPSYKNGAGFRAGVAADFAIKGDLINRIGLEPK
jgi:tripartite-type tricarboxylate transporter receptor subunit TctC